MTAMEKRAHRKKAKEERSTFNVQRSTLGATRNRAQINTSACLCASAPLRFIHLLGIFRFGCTGNLFFATLLLVLLPEAYAQPVHPFQPLPKDESLQPLPQGNAGIIDFIGAHSYTPDQLRQPLTEQIKDIQEHGLTPPRADDTAYYLAVYYRKQGFANVDVRWEIRGSRLALTIQEGARAYLRNVTFKGNKAMDDKTLFEYLIGGTRERLAKSPTAVPFVEGDVQSGVGRIRGLYESEGYLDAVVEDAAINYTSNHARADVVVSLTEGPHYIFGEITFAGTPVYSRNELSKALGESTQTPFTTQRVNTMQRNLQFYFKQHGYYAAEVESAADPKAAVAGPANSRKVPVTFTVKPGAIYHFDGTTVTGLTKLHPSVVENRFRKLSGQVYSPEKFDERFRELLHTGLFTNLRVNTTPLPNNEVRLDLTAEEAKPKEVGFSIGYSTYDGALVGVRLGDRDLFGSGRPLTLSIDYSTRAIRSELLYVDPWLFESDVNLRAKLFVQAGDEVGYSKRDTGLRLDFTRKFTKQIELGTFVQVKSVEITESAIVSSFLGSTAYQIASVGLTQSFDYRDSPVSPSKGWIITSAVDFDAIAGELAFGRATARLTEYIPIKEKYILALGARGGLIYPFTEVPIDERYFNGGGTTVRSFTEHELGPHDPHKYPIGGEAFTVFNAEFDFPIHDALLGAVFVDAGNVISEFKNAGLQDMRYAFGVGLRYKLPIGPIRLDVGFNPNPKENEDWGAVNFSFGFAF